MLEPVSYTHLDVYKRQLEICVAAYQACHFIGMPECSVHLTHAVTYLSLAPKSNALYMAYEHAKEDALKMISEPVPLQIRNAPTKLMKELHYGEGYQYAHDYEDKLTTMQCLPPTLQGTIYYEPTDVYKRQGLYMWTVFTNDVGIIATSIINPITVKVHFIIKQFAI